MVKQNAHRKFSKYVEEARTLSKFILIDIIIISSIAAAAPNVVFVDQDSSARASRGVGEESLSKAVSRNITMILEDLLKDYDKTERPSYKEGKKS